MRNSIVPVRKRTKLPGHFAWGVRPVLMSPFAEDRLPLEQLGRSLKAAGIEAAITRNPLRASTLRIRRGRGVGDPEGYRMAVAGDGIEISSRAATGAYYAIQTLRELIRVNGRQMPCCRIEDKPDFRRRGVYLDCSRGKVPTVDTLKLLVEYLASLKVNELQLYVENVFTFKKHPRIGRGFSPFTPGELLGVQDHCKLHHIRFVPSLTSFGHFERILRIPEYSHLAEMTDESGVPHGTICPTDPGSIRLVADMYGEFLPLFAAEDFNACGDEPWVLGRGRSKSRARKIGVGMVYLEFVKKLHRLCEKHGKRMNLWSDIVLNHPELIPRVPNDVVMLNWDYEPSGNRMKQTHRFEKAGIGCLVCPGVHDWQAYGTRLNKATTNISQFAAVGRKHNADGFLNTSWGDSGHRTPLGLSLHGFAFGAAHAWHGRAVRNDTFTDNFCYHIFGREGASIARRLRAMGREDIDQNQVYHSLHYPMTARGNMSRGITRISPVWEHPLRQGCGTDVAKARRAFLSRKLHPLPAVRRSRNPLGALIKEDVAIGSELLALGIRRLNLRDAITDGQSVSPGELRSMAAEHERVARGFAANWLRRNKPSRLKDNIRLFENAAEELRRLARQSGRTGVRP